MGRELDCFSLIRYYIGERVYAQIVFPNSINKTAESWRFYLQLEFQSCFFNSSVTRIKLAYASENNKATSIPMTNKEKFLVEHNKLAPQNLQATMDLLTRFRVEKHSLFKDNDWSIDRLRRPFIIWLSFAAMHEKSK